jgi:hypothetical protein
MFDSLFEHFNHMDEYHAKVDGEFMRIAAEPCMETAKVGDRVLVAGGLIGRGHLWVRIECEVVAVADTAIKVKSIGDIHKWSQWVHNTIVTDVLGPPAEDKS